MTSEQFDALKKLIRLRNSAGAAAAFCHLVHGDTIVQASRQVGCTTNAARLCVKRIKAAQKLVEVARG
jgi:hypothetical protein